MMNQMKKMKWDKVEVFRDNFNTIERDINESKKEIEQLKEENNNTTINEAIVINNVEIECSFNDIGGLKDIIDNETAKNRFNKQPVKSKINNLYSELASINTDESQEILSQLKQKLMELPIDITPKDFTAEISFFNEKITEMKNKK